LKNRKDEYLFSNAIDSRFREKFDEVADAHQFKRIRATLMYRQRKYQIRFFRDLRTYIAMLRIYEGAKNPCYTLAMNKIISSLTDQNLVAELKSLVQQEREVLAEIIRYLQEVDTRRLYLELGYSSLFSFCTQGLGYTEGSAYRRMKAARVSAETPEVLERIATGSVSLCAAVELSRVRTQIMRELLPLSEGKAKEEVKKLVAPYLAPTYTKPERVTIAPTKAPEVPKTLPLFEQKSEAPESSQAPPLRYSVTLDLSEEEYQLLEEVKQLSNSATRTQAIVSALTAFRKARSPAEREKRREERRITATVNVPARNRSRHIPDAVRDAVFVRDQGRCTYVGPDGHQCGEIRGVQLDHIHPFSCGGTHTVDNLRVRCGPHNRYVFERDWAGMIGVVGMHQERNTVPPIHTVGEE